MTGDDDVKLMTLAPTAAAAALLFGGVAMAQTPQYDGPRNPDGTPRVAHVERYDGPRTASGAPVYAHESDRRDSDRRYASYHHHHHHRHHHHHHHHDADDR
jgi:hypothetical protein